MRNQKIAWDKHLSERDRIQWYGIHEDLKLLANCQFPRHIGLDKKGSTKYQLLVFCDASRYAFAAAVYLLQECQDQRRTDLIFSKTRLVIDCLFEIRKIAVYFLWLSLPGDYRVTDEALLAETT